MSKFNVGDKFEIEIAEVFKGAESGNDKYRIKGFDNLVFDDKGLEKMKQITKAERPMGIGDVVYNDKLNQCGVIINTENNILGNDFPVVLYAKGDIDFYTSMSDLTQVKTETNIDFDGLFQALKDATYDYLLKIGE